MYALFYEYVENVVARRAPFREDHLAQIGQWRDDGRLFMAGALGDPPHGALMLFDVEDPGEIERFCATDPYVREGLVTARRIEPWAVV